MAFIGVLSVAILIGVIVWPQYWVKRVMKTHSEDREDFPGTGGELAKHLLEHYGIDGVGVEQTDKGDHYDPETRMVRLSPMNFSKSSITAVAVAAHEVGHAMQHFDGLQGLRDGGLGLRQKLVGLAQVADKVAAVFFVAAPVLAIIARTPFAFFALVAFGVALLAIRILVHLVTLPVEYDASFGKALPILEEGGYLHQDDYPAAHSVLKAAALTYVAGAIMSLIDLARWIRMIR
ncbi:MAG: zinc metallopeptidase [Rhizobiaceae bacterium]